MSFDGWVTPQGIWDDLNREFHFDLDVCATAENAKCLRYFSAETDGLTQIWSTYDCFSIWMNPPYGRGIEKWIKKAFDTGCGGSRVIALIPTRTNAPWWHDYVMRSKEIRFIRKKVSFGGPIDGVPFWGSCIVVFGPGLFGKPPTISSYYQPAKQLSLTVKDGVGQI